MNALVITSHSFAMLFEHGKLLFHGGRIITHVAGIAVLRHQFQRDFLAAAANQQRDMWLLDALGLVNSATHLIILAFKGGLFLRPHGANDLDRFAQIAQALRRIRIVVAVSAVLVLIPTCSNTEIEPSVTEYINGARHLCQQRGMAIAIARDHLADAYGSGITRQRSRGHPAFKRHFRRRVWNRVKVVNQPGGSETHLVSRLSNTRHRFVGFYGVFDPRQIHGPALGNKQTKLQCHVYDSFFFGKWKTLVFFSDVLRSPLPSEIMKGASLPFWAGLAPFRYRFFDVVKPQFAPVRERGVSALVSAPADARQRPRAVSWE